MTTMTHAPRDTVAAAAQPSQSALIHVAVPTLPEADDRLHPGAQALALGGFLVFLAASWVGWATGQTALLIVVVYVLSAMYFGLLIAAGRSSAAFRGDVTRRSFAAFLRGRTSILTGTIAGRDALVQIAFMPVVLGLTMCIFALIWLCVSS